MEIKNNTHEVVGKVNVQWLGDSQKTKWMVPMHETNMDVKGLPRGPLLQPGDIDHTTKTVSMAVNQFFDEGTLEWMNLINSL